MKTTAEQFNKRNPVGTPVKYDPIPGEYFYREENTRGTAWTSEDGTVMIKLHGIAGGVDLETIELR